jgi:hypothetical protein
MKILGLLGKKLLRPSGAGSRFGVYPRLTPWALFFRRFAAAVVALLACGCKALLLGALFTGFLSHAQEKITFRDITAQAGIQFKHNNGAFGKKYLPETMGPGCAFIDYDNDGWPDIVLVNGEDFPGHQRAPSTL